MNSLITKTLMLIALFCFAVAAAQTPGFQTKYFVSVNPSTGSYTIIDSIPGVRTVQTAPSTSTIDKQGNHYFFIGTDAANVSRLYTINTTNGAVVNSPAISPAVSPYVAVGGLEYDPASGMLLGLASATPGIQHFISMNPVTGSITSLGIIPGSAGVPMGHTTYDQIGKRYFFLGVTSNNFYTIDAITGTTISVAGISSGSATPLVPRYNNATGKLYACMPLNSFAPGRRIVEMDPATLSTTLVASLPSVSSAPNMPNYSTIDELNNRFTFLMGGPSNTSQLYSVDLATGTVVLNPAYPASANDPQTVIELRYHNAGGGLFGLHLGPSVATGIPAHDSPEIVTAVFPNPLSGCATVSLKKTEEQVLLRIISASGNVAREKCFYDVNAIEISKDDLAPGVYFVSIITSTGTSVKKVVIE